MRIAAAVTLVCCSLLLACCGPAWENRDGPSAVMQPDKVDVTVSRQMAVLQALAVTYQAHSAYEVVLAGFNYSDEVCAYYLNNLHQFERRKNRIQNTLTLANSTATAIMSAASVSKEAVIYVTQALGFSTAWVGIVADSYLYRLSPGILAGIVDTLHDALRADVSKRRGQSIPTKWRITRSVITTRCAYR